VPDQLSPYACEFLEGIRRPASPSALLSQCKGLVNCSRRDIGLLVTVLTVVAPHELRDALQELDWASTVAAIEEAEERERIAFERALRRHDNKVSYDAAVTRLEADRAELEAVLALSAVKGGRAFMAAELGLSKDQMGKLINRLADPARDNGAPSRCGT